MAVTSFDQAKRTNAVAQADLDRVHAAKRQTAIKSPGMDTSREVLRRAKSAGQGPWVPQHGDSTSDRNSTG